MAGVSKCRRWKGLLSFAAVWMMAVFFCLSLGPRAMAEESGQGAEPSVPEAPAQLGVYDGAGLLSEETKAAIVQKNTDLQAKYGVQIVVYTADLLPHSDFAQRVEYLRSVLSQWQAGGSEGRGLILALSISDSDYLAVAGDGLKAEFTTEALKSLLDTYLEPDFTVKSYDTGVSKFFAAAAGQAETYCSAHPEIFSAAPGGAEDQPEKDKNEKADLSQKKQSGLGVLLWVLLVLGVVVLVCILAFLIRYGSLIRARNRRTVHRRSSVIRPARTSVVRQETRPTVQIKAGNRSTGVYRDQRPNKRGR